MNNLIKTGEEIFDIIHYSDYPTLESVYKEKFVSISLLREEIQKKYDESYNLPGDVQDIRDLGRMDSLRWLLSLLEEKKR